MVNADGHPHEEVTKPSVASDAVTYGLFRRPALEFAARRLQGTVLALPPPPVRLLAIGCVAATALGIVAAAFVPFPSGVHATGIATSTRAMVSVRAPQGGVVLRLPVSEGQELRAGDLIAQLKTSTDVSSGDTATQIATLIADRSAFSDRSENAELAGLAAEETTLKAQRTALTEQIAGLDQQIDLQRDRVAIADGVLSRSADLVSKGVISQASLDVRRDGLLVARKELASLQERRAGLRLQAEDLAGKLATIPQRRAQIVAASQLRDSEATQSLIELQSRSQVVVRSPANGRASAIAVREGDTISAGDVIARITFGPASEIEGYVPSSARNQVKVGQPCTVTIAGANSTGRVILRAKVVSVSDAPIELSSDAKQALGILGPVYRIRIALVEKGSERPPVGSLVSIDIVTRDRSLLGRLLRPRG